MPTAAILPVKSFSRAKQRLGASVPDPLRLALAQAMVGDVLGALEQVRGVHRTIVVTREPSVAESAPAHGAVVVLDEGEDGQSAAAGLGIALALADGFERVLCVPGDCPALDPVEIQQLLDAQERSGEQVTIVPDRHGSGTNGLLLAPPDAIEPGFGPDSRERHSERASAAGLSWRVHRCESLSLDVDTGADLDALRRALVGHELRAAGTRAVLAGASAVQPLTTGA